MPLRLPKLPVFLTGFFAFLGFADAAYLTVDHYFVLPLPCSITGGCETVLTSEYSMIGPIPLAAIGAAYYLLVLFLIVYLYTMEEPKIWPAKAVWFLSGAGVLASAYFVYLQVAVLQAICLYCLVSAATSLLVFASASWLFWKVKRPPAVAEPGV